MRVSLWGRGGRGGGEGCCQNNDNIYFTFNFQYNRHPTRLALKVVSGVHPLFKFPTIFVNLNRQTKSKIKISLLLFVVVVLVKTRHACVLVLKDEALITLPAI